PQDSRTTSFVTRRSFPTVTSLGIPANLAIIGWRRRSELSVVEGALLWRSTAGRTDQLRGADQRPRGAQYAQTSRLRIEFRRLRVNFVILQKRNHGASPGGCSDPGHDACAVGADLHPNFGVVR